MKPTSANKLQVHKKGAPVAQSMNPRIGGSIMSSCQHSTTDSPCAYTWWMASLADWPVLSMYDRYFHIIIIILFLPTL